MRNNRPFDKNITRREFITYAALLGTVVTPAAIIGCFGNYGRIKSNKKVTTSFESGKLNQGLTYYIAGSDGASPTAIIGLNSNFELSNSKNWKRVELTSGSLKTLVKNMQGKVSDSLNKPNGCNIMDNEGNIP